MSRRLAVSLDDTESQALDDLCVASGLDAATAVRQLVRLGCGLSSGLTPGIRAWARDMRRGRKRPEVQR